jgi:SAM-dependent methyltransferase
LNPFDLALHDYFYKGAAKKLILHNNYGEPEEMPVSVFFREDVHLTELELYALNLCQGEILDIGAGVGVHTLELQKRLLNVTALEISPKACEIMNDRGVKIVLNTSLYDTIEQTYDTLLLLMNGFGLSGKIVNVSSFLNTIKRLLKPQGQVIVDSSDVSYMYDEKPVDQYFGEVEFCYEYKHIVGEWFNWLYIDPSSLIKVCKENNWDCQIVFKDKQDQYLAILKPNSYD